MSTRRDPDPEWVTHVCPKCGRRLGLPAGSTATATCTNQKRHPATEMKPEQQLAA